MQSKQLKVVFFGSSQHVIPIIEVLKKNFDLSLVVTTEKFDTDPIPSYCSNSKVSCYIARDFSKKTSQQLRKTKAKIGVLASFGAIVPNEILSIFPKGIINIHPSLLPKYRGPSPVQAAILNGEKITGVSIIKLDDEIDHGPILAQAKEPILENDTSESLYERLFKKGANLLLPIIRIIEQNKLPPETPQDHLKATFTKHLNRADGYIDLSSLEIGNWKLEIARRIRAYYPWPCVYTKLKMKNEKLKIIKFLPAKKIQVEGKRPVSYKDFVNGYPQTRTVMDKLLLIL